MCRLIACISLVANIGCRMETLSNNGVTCFLYKSNKYRRYYVKRNKNVCWRCTSKSCKARIETRDGIVVEESGFHCHVEKVLNTSATVLRTACKRKAELSPIMDIWTLISTRRILTFTYLLRLCCVNKLQHTLLSAHCQSRGQFQDTHVVMYAVWHIRPHSLFAGPSLSITL